jgi:hypothetical protein
VIRGDSVAHEPEGRRQSIEHVDPDLRRGAEQALGGIEAGRAGTDDRDAELAQRRADIEVTPKLTVVRVAPRTSRSDEAETSMRYHRHSFMCTTVRTPRSSRSRVPCLVVAMLLGAAAGLPVTAAQAASSFQAAALHVAYKGGGSEELDATVACSQTGQGGGGAPGGPSRTLPPPLPCPGTSVNDSPISDPGNGGALDEIGNKPVLR